MRDHNYQSRMKNCHVKLNVTIQCKSKIGIVSGVGSSTESESEGSEEFLFLLIPLPLPSLPSCRFTLDQNFLPIATPLPSLVWTSPNCSQWKIVLWEKEIIIQDYRLRFFRAGESLTVSGEYFGGIFSHPPNGGATECRRLSRVYARKLEEHTRMLIAISLLQNFSLGDLFEEFEVWT